MEEFYDKELKVMLEAEEKILSKTQFRTAKLVILPRIAFYKACLLYVDVEQAIEYGREFFYQQSDWFRKFAKGITATKASSNFFKWLFVKSLKSDVWDSEIYKYDKTGLDFNMTRCLYSDLCHKYDSKEFAPVFCGGDYFVFDDMKKLEFSRTETIGEGGQICDFHFTNKN